MRVDQKKPKVCILAYDDLCLFEFGIAMEVFALPRPEMNNWYETKVVAAKQTSFSAMGGLKFTA